jgi:hypothetical protein
MNIIIDLTPFRPCNPSEKQENKHFSVYYRKKTPKNCVFFADQKLPIWKCVRGLNLDGFVPFFV